MFDHDGRLDMQYNHIHGEFSVKLSLELEAEGRRSKIPEALRPVYLLLSIAKRAQYELNQWCSE
ncbi:hypothetical protein AVEN_112129-1, partial [Araneus ventricosus]